MNIIGKLTKAFQEAGKHFEEKSTGEKIAIVAAGVGGVAGAAVIHPLLIGAALGGVVGGATPAIIKKLGQLGK